MSRRELDGHPALTGQIPYERLSPLNLYYLYAHPSPRLRPNPAAAARVPRRRNTTLRNSEGPRGV